MRLPRKLDVLVKMRTETDPWNIAVSTVLTLLATNGFCRRKKRCSRSRGCDGGGVEDDEEEAADGKDETERECEEDAACETSQTDPASSFK